MRLDIYLVENCLISSRAKAQELIKSGGILVDGIIATKCGQEVKQNSKVELIKQTCPYVSRAGYKLEGATKDFNLNFKDKVVLDIGSSTGGFTDFCLKSGAKKVYALDVGTNQLHKDLKNNNRVVVMENTDIRVLDKQIVGDIDAIVCDVSFISLTKISHKIAEFLPVHGFGVVLIKPQFECGLSLAKKHKGIITDPKLHNLAIEEVKQNFEANNLIIKSVAPSKIKGTDGNLEFVALVTKRDNK